jgi:hypothetical protein
VRHATARPKGVPLAMMPSALSRDTQNLRAARARFLTYKKFSISG